MSEYRDDSPHLRGVVLDAGVYPTVTVHRMDSHRVWTHEKGGWIELAWETEAGAMARDAEALGPAIRAMFSTGDISLITAESPGLVTKRIQVTYERALQALRALAKDALIC